MISSSTKLAQNIFDKPDAVPTRDGWGRGVVLAGEKDKNVVVLCADLAESTRAQWFKDKFPDRYVEIGVAEQNLVTVASGMAAAGKIPFVASYAAFNPGRNYEQIRTTVALNEQPVKICGMHAGISVGPDGATHQMLEDIALMRMLPHMNVVVPCDAQEAEKATAAVAVSGRPTYLRFGREKTPVMTTEATSFEIGRAYEMWRPSTSSGQAPSTSSGQAPSTSSGQAPSTSSGQAPSTGGEQAQKPQVAIIGCGSVLYNALLAAAELEKKGIGSVVLNMHTVKPLDRMAVTALARECGRVVTVEEHQVAGGMGSAVAETLASSYPVPIEFIGVHDVFGQSGEPEELLKHYHIDALSIQAAVEKMLKR